MRLVARSRTFLPALVLIGFVGVGGGWPMGRTDVQEGPNRDPATIRLQLQWSMQAQFAGYLAAQELGFYQEEGLQVEILDGAIDLVPQDVLASGGAELAIAWVPKALVSVEAGAPLVHVAQGLQRSGTRQLSWRDSGITRPIDWAGKRVANWGFGQEHELLAAIRQAGLDPDRDLTLVPQPSDMALLLNREADAVQAMTYNEYALVLEAINPGTGRLYRLPTPRSPARRGRTLKSVSCRAVPMSLVVLPGSTLG